MGGNEFLQSEQVKIVSEKYPKITLLWVIAVTEYYLVFEVVSVVSEFFFNIG
jgi:hypothetical protein